MLYAEILIGLVLLGVYIHFQITKRKNKHYLDLINQQMSASDEIKRTLAMGLYIRFKKENEEEDEQYSSSFIKEDPLMFENFVADVIERAKGGRTWVLPPSGDFGVDFEHDTKEGKLLGQVKCWKDDLPFDPIALIHSNMVKKGAIGGYVVTTASFTDAAERYAEGLNVELIDGVKLVELWVEGLQTEEEEIKGILPEMI